MSVVAIGFFDGVHRGHQRILEGADLAVTFRNHPLTVLNAAKAPRLVMGFEDRVAAIRSCGVRDVRAFDFTTELAAQSPEEFLSFLQLQLHTSTFSLRCGANWRFGRDGEGSPDWLRVHGFSVEVVPSVEYDGGIISSTRIRDCLVRGEIAAANAMLGRRYRVTGEVVRGKGEGRRLGYPTVNVSLAPYPPSPVSHFPFLIPHSPFLTLPLGVYQVELCGRRAIANYGLAPTFGDRAWKTPVLEVHLLDGAADSSADIGPAVRVEFLRFIRPERRFGSVEELKAQIAADIADLV